MFDVVDLVYVVVVFDDVVFFDVVGFYGDLGCWGRVLFWCLGELFWSEVGSVV